MATLLDTLLTRIGFDLDDDGLNKAKTKFNETRQSIDKAANGMAVAGATLTAALVGVGKNVLEFEKEMNALRAATNATDEDMAAMRKQAQKLGRETAFSASQAAQAQAELGRAGFETSKIIKTMPSVLALAAAGQLSMGEAAGITTSIMAAFKMEAEDSGKISDVLAAAAASAKTSVSEMGFAFSKVAPTAQSLGMSLEETGAMLATLQNNGLEASVAGTGLKTIMLRLAKPSKEASAALASMGMSMDDVQKAVKGGKIAELLAKMGEKNMDAAKAAAIFGSEATTQALILANGTKSVNDLTKAYEGAGGAAQRMADQQMAGLPGAVASLSSKFEGMLLALGDAGVTGALMNMASVLGTLLDKFNGAPPVVKKIIAFLLTLGPILTMAAILLKGVAIAMGALNFAMSANPFVLLALGAIAALTALLYFWDDIVAAVKSGFDYISGAFGKIGKFLGFGVGEINTTQNLTAPVGATLKPSANVGAAGNQTNSVSIQNLTVDAKGGDSREIAQNVGVAMRDQMLNTAQDFDGSVAR